MMNKEEICQMRDDMQKGVKMFVQEMEKIGREKNLDWQKVMYMSDILKDMSEVEKNIAKANYYDRKVN